MFACQDFWLHTEGGVAITQLAAISFDAGELLSASNWLNLPPRSIIIAFGQLSGDRGEGMKN